MNSRSPLTPKNPAGPLLAALIGRISTEQQDEANIAASFEYDRRCLNELYSGEVEFTGMASAAAACSSIVR